MRKIIFSFFLILILFPLMSFADNHIGPHSIDRTFDYDIGNNEICSKEDRSRYETHIKQITTSTDKGTISFKIKNISKDTLIFDYDSFNYVRSTFILLDVSKERIIPKDKHTFISGPKGYFALEPDEEEEIKHYLDYSYENINERINSSEIIFIWASRIILRNVEFPSSCKLTGSIYLAG